MNYTELIEEKVFSKATANTFVCVLITKSGYEVLGFHSFLDEDGSDELGFRAAEGDALLKLAELERYVDFYTKE